MVSIISSVNPITYMHILSYLVQIVYIDLHVSFVVILYGSLHMVYTKVIKWEACWPRILWLVINICSYRVTNKYNFSFLFVKWFSAWSLFFFKFCTRCDDWCYGKIREKVKSVFCNTCFINQIFPLKPENFKQINHMLCKVVKTQVVSLSYLDRKHARIHLDSA